MNMKVMLQMKLIVIDLTNVIRNSANNLMNKAHQQ